MGSIDGTIKLSKIIPFIFLFSLFLIIIIYSGLSNSTNIHIAYCLFILSALLGLLYESKNITGSFRFAGIFITISSIISGIFILLNGEARADVFTFQMQLLLLAIVSIYLMIINLTFEKQITIRLHEGLTMVQSVAVAYWYIDASVTGEIETIINPGAAIGFGFVCHSIYHGLTRRKLTDEARTVLSFWSCASVFIFVFDNFQNLQNQNIVFPVTTLEITFSVFSFFFIGISGVYMVRNIRLLFSMISKDEDTRRKAVDIQLSRYSRDQFNPGIASILFIICLCIFGINLYFRLMPRQILIWLVFVSLPYLAAISDVIEERLYPSRRWIKRAPDPYEYEDE